MPACLQATPRNNRMNANEVLISNALQAAEPRLGKNVKLPKLTQHMREAIGRRGSKQNTAKGAAAIKGVHPAW